MSTNRPHARETGAADTVTSFNQIVQENEERMARGEELTGYYHYTPLRCPQCQNLMVKFYEEKQHTKHRCIRCQIVVDCPEGEG